MHAIFPLKISPTTETKDLESALSDIVTNTIDIHGRWYDVRITNLHYGPSHETYIVNKARSWNDDLKARVMSTAPLLAQENMPQAVIEDLYNGVHDLKDEWSLKSNVALIYDTCLVCPDLDVRFCDIRTVMLNKILKDITCHPENYAYADIYIEQN